MFILSLIILFVGICTEIVFEELCKIYDSDPNKILEDHEVVWGWDNYGEPLLKYTDKNTKELVTMV